jgi:prepilin signal peptidase PulO-like enzyme (type II secretory pathway)
MALVACPDCRQNISSEATMCIHCGRPLDPRRTQVDYVTGETLGIRPRPAAQAARRPLRYPSTVGVAMMAAGSGLIILGSFMPWVRQGTVSVSGMQSDGRITLVIGVVTLILGVSARTSHSRLPRVMVTLGAILVLIIAVVDNRRLRDGLADDLVGAGLRTVFVGGVIALMGSFLRDRYR